PGCGTRPRGPSDVGGAGRLLDLQPRLEDSGRRAAAGLERDRGAVLEVAGLDRLDHEGDDQVRPGRERGPRPGEDGVAPARIRRGVAGEELQPIGQLVADVELERVRGAAVL